MRVARILLQPPTQLRVLLYQRVDPPIRLSQRRLYDRQLVKQLHYGRRLGHAVIINIHRA
jgi:ABC-type ATPase with predicted acetyltransferase domain